MPVHFARLRLAGFKSFAEPQIIELRSRLIGIVGPNGCGKSNLVDALRWVMGEGSARNLRGGEMDDVIFAGTAQRPRRNIAEVVLTLEVTAGVVPPPFDEAGEIEIGRRLERGVGSSFRLNGREVRARDVATLFADLATGARGSGLVSQGRVAALIAGRPEDRRALLEEAAGISGIYARRHEAELKLKAAEENLNRAEDLRAELETEISGLRRQARQASRWRNLSSSIRAAEAELLALERARAEAARSKSAELLATVKLALADRIARAAAEAAAQAAAASALPGLREAEADSRSARERARLARQVEEEERERAAAALAAAQSRCAEIARDLEHAERMAREAAGTVEHLAAEAAALERQAASHGPLAEAAAARLTAAEAKVRETEEWATKAAEAAARVTAEAEATARERAQAALRAERGREAAEVAVRTYELAVERAIPEAEQALARSAAETAEKELGEARAQAEATDQALPTRRAAAGAARAAAIEAEARQTRLAAEAAGLTRLLGTAPARSLAPLADGLHVPRGLEAALAAGLGEAMSAATDIAAPRHWRLLPPFDSPPPLPAGAMPLAALIQAPIAAARALSQIGLIEATEDAARIQTELAPGQALVSQAGELWRWDGYCERAGAPKPEAVWLENRNRLAEIEASLTEARARSLAAAAARKIAEAEESAAEAADRAARRHAAEAEKAAFRTREQASRLATQSAQLNERLAALATERDRLAGEAKEARMALDRLMGITPPDPASARVARERAQAELAAAREQEVAARRSAADLERAASERRARISRIVRESEEWAQRKAESEARLADLAARAAQAEAERAALAARPAELALSAARAIEAMQAAEAAHARAADDLLAGEAAAAASSRAARTAEAELAQTRELVLRAEAALTAVERELGLVEERICARLGPSPALPDPPATTDAAAEEAAKRRLERLEHEREAMGPVNLRADIEAAEVENRIAALERERTELAAAIAKLRGSIGHLNREGRERVGAVFAAVDRHFQALFARMFGGGKAHLALVGSDNPLEAGIEVYAEPPGKRLTTLSLLSGGEQALIALALIFAVFRCNPAPLCVLDEVDAPLDDANVGRFCNLIEEMARAEITRFLVISHHPLTMARMDRLFGVTMQERGVSRLLSVDLMAASALAERAGVAVA